MFSKNSVMVSGWKKRFDLGVTEFRKANYSAALAHFDDVQLANDFS